MKNILIRIIFALVFVTPQTINAQSPRDTLNQYVAELQKSSNDISLREKIISLSLRIKPAPAIPKDAREKYVMGITLRESKDYKLAISQFKEALLIAPWYGDAYKDLGLSLEFAEEYNEGIQAFQLYILTQPGDITVTNTEDEIGIMKAKKMKAENEKRKSKAEQKAFEGHWVQSSPWKYNHGQELPLSIAISSFNISFDVNGIAKVMYHFNPSIGDSNITEFRGSLVNGELVVNPIQLDYEENKRELRFHVTQQGLFLQTTILRNIGDRSEMTIEYNLRR